MSTPRAEVYAAVMEGLAPLLYGPTWQRELSRAIGVDPRLVRRWKARDRPTPEWVAERVLAMVEERWRLLDAQATLARSLLRGAA